MGMTARNKIPWVMEVTMLKASCSPLTVAFSSSGLYQPAEGTCHWGQLPHGVQTE